jgi:exopolyphosphatase/guanosine-5'-triphosphate,3'-diphosphate pyrophosphatase
VGVRPQFLSGEDEARLTYLAVATSKTFKQLARLAGAPPQREGPFVPRTLTANDVSQWIPRLARRRADQRAKLTGISEPRASQILAGAVVAKSTMEALNVGLCPWALREGIMLHYLQSSLNQTWSLPLQPVSPEVPRPAPAKVHQLHTAQRDPSA